MSGKQLNHRIGMRFVYALANHNRVNCLPSPSLTSVSQVHVYKCLIVLSSTHLLALSC